MRICFCQSFGHVFIPSPLALSLRPAFHFWSFFRKLFQIFTLFSAQLFSKKTKGIVIALSSAIVVGVVVGVVVRKL